MTTTPTPTTLPAAIIETLHAVAAWQQHINDALAAGDRHEAEGCFQQRSAAGRRLLDWEGSDPERQAAVAAYLAAHGVDDPRHLPAVTA